MNPILFQRLHDKAVLPTRGTPLSAGWDLFAATAEWDASLKLIKVGFGFATAIPEGHGVLVLPRSGLAIKRGLTLANDVALIDADYRGEWLGYFEARKSTTIQPGERVAQAVLIKLPETEWQVVDSLPGTDRGAGGFGSTGVL